MWIRAFLTGLCAVIAVAAMPMSTNSSLVVERDDGPRVLHGYLPPSQGIRCDIDDLGPTAHGDGIAQIVAYLKTIDDKPPVMNPGTRQRVGCYFGAAIWWEAIRYNTHPIALEGWDMIWKAVEDIKSQCIHHEWPHLPCCQEIKHWQVSGLAEFDDYVVWILGGADCSYTDAMGGPPQDTILTTAVASAAIAAATPGF